MKKTMTTIILATVPVLGWAHAGGREVKGTIQKTARTSVQVKTTAGKVETFALTPKTKFTRGGIAGVAADMRIGSRTIVHLGKDGRVLEVQLPSQKVGTLQGRIISRDEEKNLLKVEHETVQGIMSAMTMSFPVSDAGVGALPENGTSITARLHAAGGEYWLTEVKRLQ